MQAGGVLRFCSDPCMVEFEKYSANNNWFGLDSACPAGPLQDLLLLRVMTFVPECPFWSLLAMVRRREPQCLMRVCIVVANYARARTFHTFATSQEEILLCLTGHLCCLLCMLLLGFHKAVGHGVKAPHIDKIRW